MAEPVPSSAPRLLFVPVSGSRGSGEFYRSLTLAHAALRRWPQAQIQFILNHEAGYAGRALQREGVEFEMIDGSPTRNTAEVNRLILRIQPHVVIFDSAGRHAQLLCARKVGARTVYISSRPKTRWKGFRLRRMRLMDQHWLAWPPFLGGELTAWERFKLRFAPRLKVVHLGPLLPEYLNAAAPVLERLGVRRGEYVLFCAGGGGYSYGGRSAPEIFGQAADTVARSAQLPVVWVRGPNYAGAEIGSVHVRTLDALSLEQMIDILAGSRLAAINGGSLLLQALALKVPCVAAPVAGDQPRRIQSCAARQIAIAAALDADALGGAVLALLQDAPQLAAMRTRLESLNLVNGVEPALAALEELLKETKEDRA